MDRRRIYSMFSRKSNVAIGVADDLQQTFAVAQIDENDAPVVAAAMNPSADGNDLAESGTVDAATIVSASHVLLRRRIDGFSGVPKARSLAARARRRQRRELLAVNFGG